ncbi:MAG: D-alanyl-D-alanine carboxypeptidase [Methylocystis sp.]|nr:D-alanyl-D-alanine carboxypeptidase [Methylocystis sp.]
MGAKTIRCSLTALCAAPAMWGVSASAAPSVVIDVASGQILQQEQATQAWYPASLTKLMTVYVALDAVRTQRLTLDTPLLVSPGAVKMAPTKMGFRPGSEVTLRNALVMLMVKSANDIAVTIAEGVSGSVDAFADEMNKAAASLGMQESHWVNPNGLPDARQVTSARDLAILGRALYLQFPESAGLFNIGAMKLGSRIIPTHNGLLGRYPGADGMKTGFTCPAGFNLVASATHGGQRLIAVVLGAPSASARTAKAAALLDRAFMTGSAMGSIASLPTFGVASAPDMRDSVCRRRGKATAKFLAEVEDMSIAIPPEYGVGSGGAPARINVKAIAGLPRPRFEPVPVYVGRPSGYEGPVAGARDPGAPLGTLSPTAYAGEKTEGAEAAGAPIAHGVASMRRHAASKPHAHTAHLHGKPRHGAKHATTKQPHKVVVAKVEKHAVGHHGSKRQAAGKEQ